MFVTNDARGKVLRCGDRVHPIHALRSVRKKTANGRLLPVLRSRRIAEITDHTLNVECDCVDGCKRCNGAKVFTVLDKTVITLQGARKRQYAGSDLIKE